MMAGRTSGLNNVWRYGALVFGLSTLSLTAQVTSGITAISCSTTSNTSTSTSANTVTFAGMTCSVTMPSAAVTTPVTTTPVTTTPVTTTPVTTPTPVVTSVPLAPLQAAGTGGSGNASTTVSLNAVAGHTLIAAVSYFSMDSLTVPAGWTIAKAGLGTAPASCPTETANNLGICLLTHVVASGDPSSYTFTQSGSDGISAILMDVPGANLGIPINAVVGGNGGGGPITGIAATPSTVGTLPIMCVAPSGPTTPIAPTGWAIDQTVTSSNYHSLFCLHRTTPTTDTTTPIMTNVAVTTPVIFSTSMTFLVAPVPVVSNPTAAIAGSYYPSATIPVVFDGSSSSDPNGEALTYAWNFGDGGRGVGATPIHTYATNGSYTATLTVTNKDSLTGVITTPVTVQVSPAVTGVGVNAPLNGWVPNPGGAAHVDVSSWPLDANSSAIVSNLGATSPHLDFGSSKYGSPGIPYSIKPAATPRVMWTDLTPAVGGIGFSGSDDAAMPFYVGMPIEGNPGDNVLADNADQHTLTLTQDGVDYETWRTVYCSACKTNFEAAQGTIWDLTQDEKRPYSMTSADAAGLPIFPFLYRYDEVLAGTFNHAFRFTENWFGCEYNTGSGYGTFVDPAVHSACTGMSQNYMGMRIRLKAGYTSTTCTSKVDQMLLTAMKKYGGIAADRGGNMYISGVPDDRWPDDDIIGCIGTIPVSNFEVVKDPNSTIYAGDRYPKGVPPVINSFAASTAAVASGQPVTLSWDITGASYIFIDQVGIVRGNTGSVVVNPTATTTYTIVPTNRFMVNDDGFGDGQRATASVTVTVSNSTSSSTIRHSVAPEK